VKKISLIKPLLEVIEPVIIVGNSPTILREKKGDLIDKFNTIIRFNDFKIKDFTPHVGNKTTINFISNSHFYSNNTTDKNFKTIVVDNSFKINESEILNRKYYQSDDYAATMLRYKYGPFVNLLRTSDNKGTWLNLLYPKNITLGLLATLLMVDNSIKPTIYGIDFDHKSKSQYFKNTKDHDVGHSYFYEKKIFNRLKIQNKISYL
jgi:hypothetical protein